MADSRADEQLVRSLQKELWNLRYENDCMNRVMENNLFKIQELNKENDDMNRTLQRSYAEIAQKEMELNHFKTQKHLRREQIDKMRLEIQTDQMRKSENEEKIKELEQRWKVEKANEKTFVELITKRLHVIKNKVLNAPWVISRNKDENELAAYHLRIKEMLVKKEQLQRSVQQKEAILAECTKIPFQHFCIAAARGALRNRQLLKKLAIERVIVARLEKELLDQGIEDISMIEYQSDLSSPSSQKVEENEMKLTSHGANINYSTINEGGDWVGNKQMTKNGGDSTIKFQDIEADSLTSSNFTESHEPVKDEILAEEDGIKIIRLVDERTDSTSWITNLNTTGNSSYNPGTDSFLSTFPNYSANVSAINMFNTNTNVVKNTYFPSAFGFGESSHEQSGADLNSVGGTARDSSYSNDYQSFRRQFKGLSSGLYNNQFF